MESTGRWKKHRILVFTFVVFNTASSNTFSGNTANVSSERQFAETVSGQHTLPSWYYASVGAVPKHGTAGLHSQNRWRTQMAFSKTVYSFEVKEDTLPGTVVGKVGITFTSLTPITYSVQEDDGENLFLLSPLSGDFLLSRSLDFETQRFFILTVVAQQGDSQVSSVRVYFNVLDVNDNPPVFSKDDFSASLLENTRVGTCFLSFNVSDKDDGINGDLNLQVVNGNEDQVFVINPSGSLCLNAELDRERQSSYNLTVTANDCALPLALQFTSTVHVVIVVDDVNDNAPLFVTASSVSVSEDAALHSVVMTVHAVDADVGSNGEVLYFLNNTSGGNFSIDTGNGTIYLQETLDREHIDVFTVRLTATDKGSPKLETTVNLTIKVEDVNDHDPEFSQSTYSLTVREDIPTGQSLLQVHAHDQDIGPNGQVRYVLTQESPFVVDSVRGVITVMDKLDRERDSNYTLNIMAVDQGNLPRSATAEVSVTVLDVNDFAPMFSPKTLSIHVMENEVDPFHLTHQVSALDEDLSINSQLMYFIQKGNDDGLFSITPNGTFQILRSLDREKESIYNLVITAVDSGIPPLTGTLTIHVIVDDMNDNRPEFTEDVYNTIVSEDSPSGTVFAMIMASDIDEGDNGEIRYFMENTDVPFSIEETSGELYTTDLLDRETVAIYRLTVIGSDKHPTEPLSSSVVVTVLIGDINDHWPHFLNSPYVAYVPTEMDAGSVVCAVKATDEDIEMNAELHYSLYGPSADLFSIDPYSGTVFTSAALRRTEDVILNVHVEDAGENPKYDFTTVSIRFQNVSEFPEIRVDPLNYSLSEDDPVGTLLTVVAATTVRAQPVSFYLASGNYEEMFHVNQLNGNLTVENPLDYENKKEFTLLIEARDSGSPPFSSFIEIHINITDVNDNVPLFTQVEYRCEVFENSPPSWVCDVLAIDADSGIYGTVQYNITEGNMDYIFIIDPENGLLSTTASLDRENIPEFNLTVEAAELDNPLHKDRATVIVSVLDRNDNAPRFAQIFISEVPEDAPIGQTVIQVTSTDDDTDAYAGINYSIVDYSEYMPFYIDFDTGYIIVQQPLDRELEDHYIVKINANDSAWSISTDVTIIITDVNDNIPVFSEHLYSVFLSESTDEEVFVLQVLATDADTGENGHILYIIEPPNERFWVNASTGEIYTKQPLMLQNSDYDIFQFTVVAFDCGSDPLHSNTTVIVTLEPHNHYAPVFLPLQRVIAIPYDMFIGTEVVQFTAIDQDINNSSTDIEYYLIGGNASEFFWIHGDTGKVVLNQSLSESINVFLTFSVEAKDKGLPPLSSQTQITFEITGTNQFSPSFKEPDVTFTVPEDLPEGSVIGKIEAEDEDSGSNGVIMYCITEETLHLPFSVGESSGLIILTRELDFEKESIYQFQITATDGGWASKSGLSNVTVVVVDVNDNPPVFLVPEYIISLPENSEIGTNVLDVKAADADSGPYAQISYSLTAGHVDKFVIDSRNGTITTLEIFDYEQEPTFDITIKASNLDGHSLFSLAHVVIQISDVNEFKPSFKAKEFHFSVSRNVPIATRVGKVIATDHDRGPEGQVFYLMFGQNKNMGFEINQISGEIYTTSSLRKQGNTQVVLKVLAKNSGVITGMDVDEALVQISVIDINDAPMFSSSLYFANVTEDSEVGTYVTTVSALDQDSVLKWNHFFFSIEKGNTNFPFAVNPSTGVISVNSPLDREQWPMYNLTVTATDNGSPPATGTTNVIVTVVDVNDNAPKLTVTEAQLKENLPQGTVVVKLNATDSDLPPNQGPFTYWLVNPVIDTTFSLTPDGVLFTTRPVDREQTAVYKLQVAVRDAGVPPLSSTTMFHIRIMDENDNPSIPRNIYIEVKYFGNSFQGGIIGDVRPEDHDQYDTFTCVVKSGPLAMFAIANGTCELSSAPFQGEATYNITIEATDQFHDPVNNSVYINYKGFTNASVDNCILFYVSSTSMGEFLSNQYLRFVKALDSLFNLQASKTHLFGMKRIGSEILLLAAVKNYNGQYLSKELASGISSSHKKLLESQSNVTISHITSDPCSTSPCHNGASCNKNIYISQEVAVLESVAVIFVSPQKEIFNCTCLAGFTGTACEYDIDECEARPCKNEGTCVNTLGSFYCHCQSGFSGPVCATDINECLKLNCQNNGTCIHNQDGYWCRCVPGFEGEACEKFIDHCRSTPCVHGSCINSQTGFTCLCPFGVSGIHCEEQSYGFEELSFMEFPPLDRRTNLISLEFATVQRNSLLLYNPGGPATEEYLALEIRDGAVHLSYDLGSGPVMLQTNKQVADGHFHKISARRVGSMGFLHVDNCTETENNGFCFSQNAGHIFERMLDVGNINMTLGGLRTVESVLLHPEQIQTHDFVGCIRNINVNGVVLRSSMALATYNILERCPRPMVSPCQSNPCKNGGVCHDLWSDYLCECKHPYTGSNCAKEIPEEVMLQFQGNEYIEYIIKERFKRDYLIKYNLDERKEVSTEALPVINIKFKTKENGVLVFVLGQTGFIVLKIKDRKLGCTSKDNPSGNLSDLTVNAVVGDGRWHVLSLFSNKHNTFVLVDGKLVVNITERNIDLTPPNVEKIVLGAGDSSAQQSGFAGCVQYFNMSGHTLPVSGHSEVVEVWPSSTLVQSSCVSPDVCFPSPCSEEDLGTRTWRRCGPGGQSGSCVCLHNVSDQMCDFCSTQNLGRCFETQAGDAVPLWIIAVVLPVFSVLAFIALFVALYRARRQNAKCQRNSLSQRAEQGTDNAVFCFDDGRTLADAVRAEKVHPPKLSSDQQRSSVKRDASLVSVQPVSNSGVEYCEINSVCSEFFNSDATSVKLTWHKHFYSKKYTKSDHRQWGDLKMLLASFKKGPSGEEASSGPIKPPKVTTLTKHLLTKTDIEQIKHSPSCYATKFLQPELLEPVQPLTFDEIRKLNSPLESKEKHWTPKRSSPVKSTAIIDFSSDSETDSTFTCTESDYGQFSVRTYVHKQSAHSFRQQSILPVNSLFKQTCCCAQGQRKTEGTPTNAFEQMEFILNMQLPFRVYAPVFDDIARLPFGATHSNDMQSDIEEII
ncbi:protocadherin Fat 4 [Sphaeramia orbicularis]|uniref:protocadherin Fat 4 n=1 Tax=Sphaeramia orbicularis TaxID=375764 RepID=UPI00117F84F3|nr:protocadherin Fat 4-like [Sphaeramia orbicularis]